MSSEILSAVANLLDLPGNWITRASEQSEIVNQVRDYYFGNHPVKLNDTMKNILNYRGTKYWFGVNYCQLVVDEMKNRLNLEALQVEDDQDLQEYVDKMLAMNEMQLLQTDTHLATVRDGDTFIVCEWDNEEERVGLHINYKFNGRTGVLPIFRDGKLHRAAKISQIDDDNSAVVIYTLDSVQHYVYNADFGLKLVRSYAWEPKYLPVVLFSNRRLSGEEYGQSEMLSMLGLQDALNATVITAMGAAYLAGFPTSVWKGPLAGKVPDNLGPGSNVEFKSEDPALLSSADFSYNDAPSFDGTMALITDLVHHIGSVTSTPLDAGRERSAEAQKEAGSKLLAKIKSTHIRLSPSWKQVLRVAVELANTYGGKSYKTPEIITARWSDIQVRNNLEIVDIWRVIYDAIFPLNPELAGEVFLRGTSEITQLTDSEIEGFDLKTGLEMMAYGREGQAAGSGNSGGSQGAAGGSKKNRGSAKEGKRGTPTSGEQLKGRGGRSKDARGGR